GAATAVSGGDPAPDVAERLLRGELPVRPDDLPQIARALGVGADPRSRTLQERLRRIPPPEDLPALPAFRRRLTATATVEGWSRSASHALHYEVPAATLLQAAGAAGHAVLAGPVPPTGRARVVAVPDVEGLRLTVTPPLPG